MHSQHTRSRLSAQGKTEQRAIASSYLLCKPCYPPQALKSLEKFGADSLTFRY
ncbi:hypothetical protein [Leptolyngbya sp. AN02str]|uniref:hypothetical protein n=1 Tax=Leptolyngbya sp. AN02str TaxID=3423363 RepID=UPI003D31E45E